jgi:hypothetical protein
VFEDVRRAFRELLHGNPPSDVRRSALADMRETLVRARMGIDDLRGGVAETRARLESERRELDTVRRRKTLAAGINDTQTVGVAERYERQHAERVALYERKLETQEAELAMLEREVEEMTREYKGASAGVGSGLTPEVTEAASADPLGPTDGALREDIDRLARQQRRAAAEADADARLAALKRRMGQ